MEKLKMSEIHLKPFEEQLRDAIIDGELTRAEERGKEIGIEEGIEKGKEIGIEEGIEKGKEIGIMEGKEIGIEKGLKIGLKIGIEKGEENIIKRMLKKYNVEEVSKMTEIDIKQIKAIKTKL